MASRPLMACINGGETVELTQGRTDGGSALRFPGIEVARSWRGLRLHQGWLGGRAVGVATGRSWARWGGVTASASRARCCAGSRWAAPGLGRVARCVASHGVSRLRVGCSAGRERGRERVGGGGGCQGGRGGRLGLGGAR
jgi:hypothetical protein